MKRIRRAGILPASMPAETRTEAAVEEDCIPNIGPLGRQRRMRYGVRLFLAAAVLAAALVVSGAARSWRLLMLPMLWAAATGVFQARGKT